FELSPHVARADDVALCVACQLAGDVDRLTGACDGDDVRIGGLPLLHANVQARRLDPVDLHGHALSRSDVAPADAAPLPTLQSGKAAHTRHPAEARGRARDAVDMLLSLILFVLFLRPPFFDPRPPHIP